MTHEEIKKIAEEYADKHYMSGCFSVDGEFRVNLSDLRYFYETLLSDLTARYYLVEKGKVEEEYKEACDEIAFETETKSVLHQNVALGKKSLLEDLFGFEPFNKKEE